MSDAIPSRAAKVWLPEGANRGLGRVEGGWRHEPDWDKIVMAEPGARCYSRGECRVILGRQPDSRRWHLSISCPDRNPTWEEIRDARYSLMPKQITVAMILPKPEDYLNVMEFCFHLHQIDEGAVD